MKPFERSVSVSFDVAMTDLNHVGQKRRSYLDIPGGLKLQYHAIGSKRGTMPSSSLPFHLFLFFLLFLRIILSNDFLCNCVFTKQPGIVWFYVRLSGAIERPAVTPSRKAVVKSEPLSSQDVDSSPLKKKKKKKKRSADVATE